jgi:hypothetical protein
MPEYPAEIRRTFIMGPDSLAVVRYFVGYGGLDAAFEILIPALVCLDIIVPAAARDRVLFVVYCAYVVVAGAAVDLVVSSSFEKAKG